MARVIETMRPLPIERLPDVPHYVLGLSLVRGLPTPVVDVNRLLGDEGGGPLTRFVTVRAGERVIALAVGGVVGVGEIGPEALSAGAPLTEAALAGAVGAIGRLDRELLIVLESARIVPDDVWPLVEAAAR